MLNVMRYDQWMNEWEMRKLRRSLYVITGHYFMSFSFFLQCDVTKNDFACVIKNELGEVCMQQINRQMGRPHI